MAFESRDVPDYHCLEGFADSADMLFTVNGCLRIVKGDIQDDGPRRWKAYFLKRRTPTERSPIALRWVGNARVAFYAARLPIKNVHLFHVTPRMT